MNRWVLLGSLLLGAALPAAAAEAPQQLPLEAQWCLEPPAEGADQPVCIELEVARTPRQQALGLMLRPPLGPLRGMWFPVEPARRLSFWMHRTPSPLDMVFIRDGRILAIEADATPCPRLPCPSYGPTEPADGVVELQAGEAARLGLLPGQPVRIRSTTNRP